jgi:hypothetical protein
MQQQDVAQQTTETKPSSAVTIAAIQESAPMKAEEEDPNATEDEAPRAGAQGDDDDDTMDQSSDEKESSRPTETASGDWYATGTRRIVWWLLTISYRVAKCNDVLDQVLEHADAWPFQDPVDSIEVGLGCSLEALATVSKCDLAGGLLL